MRKEAEQELLQYGMITGDELHVAKLKSRNNHVSVLLNLLEGRSAQSCKDIAEALARHYHIPLLSLDKIAPPKRMMAQCDPKLARKLHFLPIAEHGDRIVVGMVDPLDLHYNDQVRAVFQKSIQPVFISMKDFERNYYRFFRKGVPLPAQNPILMNTGVLKKSFLGDTPVDPAVDEKELIAKKFTTTILSKALTIGASSFSLEPQQDVSLVNFTVGGSEYNLYRLSISHHQAMVQALMRLARLDPAKHAGIDQFSRCQVKFQGKQQILAYRFRQTPTGERVTVHIIDPGLNQLTLEELGLSNQAANQLQQALTSSGIVLVTGSSGSGKSTVLQAMARHAAGLGKRVYTIEDIVGLKIERVFQFQADPHGPSKAKILKAMQKKEAEIIVVDEIDSETLPTAIDAAESGALLLLSMTAPDISHALTKLLRSGVSRERLASLLKLVSTHKVIRKLCQTCKTVTTIHPTTMQHWEIPAHIQFQTDVGCSVCGDKGYDGVLNLTEQLPVSPDIAKLIRQGASGPEIYKVGRREGMLSLIEMGFNRAIDGKTSLEEVLAAIPYDQTFSVKQQLRMGRVMPLGKSDEPQSSQAKVDFSELVQSPAPVDDAAVFPATETDSDIVASDLSASNLSAADEPDEEKIEAIHTTAAPPVDERDSHKANILLVDDSPVTLEFTRHILNVSGHFNVDTATTAHQALEMLQTKQYHLVITDQEMPEQTGQEFIEHIRQHPALNSVGTILLTGNLNEMSALEGGADGYIAKPTDPELLVARAKSISAIYRRLAAPVAIKQPVAAPATAPRQHSITPGKVEFTKADLAKTPSFELDVPVSKSASPAAAKALSPAEKEADSEFDGLFK